MSAAQSPEDVPIDALEIVDELVQMGHGAVVQHAIDRVRLRNYQRAFEEMRAESEKPVGRAKRS